MSYFLLFVIDKDDFSPSPCGNGGTCVDGMNSYNCSCKEGFIDMNCEKG